MRASRGLWGIVPVLLGLMLLLPVTTASSVPWVGKASSCSNLIYCTYTFSSGNLTGWAKTGYSGSGYGITFQLPGESGSTGIVKFLTLTVHNVNATTDAVNGTFAAPDANSGYMVFGSTSDHIRVTAHCYRGCSYTYTLLQGTIFVNVTSLVGTTMTFGCSPSSIHPQQSTNCTATVKDLVNASVYPTGRISFGVNTIGGGHFSNKGVCHLVKGTCSLKFTSSDNAAGGVGVSASYAGTSVYYPASASATVVVYCPGGC